MSHGLGSYRILGIVSGDRVEHEGGIPHRTRDWTYGVSGRCRREHAVAAHEWHGWPQSYQISYGCGAADRATGVFANPDRGEVRGNTGPGSARRATRIAHGVVSISDGPCCRPEIPGR